VVTPNIPEALAILKFVPGYENATEPVINTVEDMEQVAKALHTLGPAYVLVKGGHLALHPEAHGADASLSKELVDVLYDGQRFEYIRGPLIKSNNVHGTGCTLSSAIASELAKGVPVVQVCVITFYLFLRTLPYFLCSATGTLNIHY
jgi:hydroxymethylpyrimidine/phosphomethylpyrimidine kinase